MLSSRRLPNAREIRCIEKLKGRWSETSQKLISKKARSKIRPAIRDF
jgi:hypothetical protein